MNKRTSLRTRLPARQGGGTTTKQSHLFYKVRLGLLHYSYLWYDAFTMTFFGKFLSEYNSLAFFRRGKGLVKKIYSFIFILILLSSFQTSNKQSAVTTIPLKSTFITIDELNNLYAVIGENSLKKYDQNGKELYLYSSKKYGKLTSIDAKNSLRTLLFFQEFSTIILVDNTLAETGLLQLQNLNMFRIGAVCTSFDNNIWVFDELEFKFKKINNSLEIVKESLDLSNLLKKTIYPNFMIERNNWLYINVPDYGILVFDIYATYYKTIPVKGLKSFQVKENNLFYSKDNILFKYNMKTLHTDTISVFSSSSQVNQWYIGERNTFILTGDSIIIKR